MPEKPMIKLVVSDIDGTLLFNAGTISEANKLSIKKLLDMGIKFALSTGRFEEGTRAIRESLNLSPKAMAFSYDNGNHIVADGKTILNRSLSPSDMLDLLKFLKNYNCTAVLYSDKNWFIENFNSPWYDKVNRFYPNMGVVLDFTESNLNRIYSKNPATKIAIRAIPKDMPLIVEALKEKYKNKYCYFLSHDEILELNYYGVSKASALKYIADYYSIPISQTMAIGDFDNDAEMIAESGFGVCMANGSPLAKSKAKFIADSCENDGFAKAMEELLLESL